MKTAYLDIETSYIGRFGDERLFKDFENHKITIIGIRIFDGVVDSFIQLVDEDISKENLLRALAGVQRLVTYNGRSIPDSVKGYVGFDFPVIRAQLGVVLDREFEYLDLCPASWKAGLWGGQKAVEKALGIARTMPGKDGAWADKTWKRYKQTKDQGLLQELLTYNREDVFMLRRIEEALRKLQR